jgi:hypothetical protein
MVTANMADYEIGASHIPHIIDAIATSGDPTLDAVMEMLDEIDDQVRQGRAVIISINPAE